MRKLLLAINIMAVTGVFLLSGININLSSSITSISGDLLSIETLKLYEFFIRKLLHFTGYFTLTILFFLYLFSHNSISLKKAAATAPATALIIAFVDESLQAAVPGRTGIILDVLIDSAGILLAVVIIIFFTTSQKIIDSRKIT